MSTVKLNWGKNEVEVKVPEKLEENIQEEFNKFNKVFKTDFFKDFLDFFKIAMNLKKEEEKEIKLMSIKSVKE